MLLGGALYPAPGCIAFVVANAFHLIEAGDRVAHVAGVVERLLALLRKRELILVELVALGFAKFGHWILLPLPKRANRNACSKSSCLSPGAEGRGKRRGSRQSSGESNGFAERLADRLLTLLRADGKAVGSDELWLDADEVEDAAQVALEMLERGSGRSFIVEATARQRDDHALAPRETLGTGRGVTEGGAGNNDPVDPGLELGRQCEIVHRRADHDRLGGEEFVEHGRVGERIECQVRERVRGKVAIDDLLAPVGPLHLLDDRAGDGAAGAVVAIDAGVDMQDGHYCLLSMDLLPRHSK